MNFKLGKKRNCPVLSWKYLLLLITVILFLSSVQINAQVTKMDAKGMDSLLKNLPENASPGDKVEYITMLISVDSSQGLYFEKRGEAYSAMQQDDKALRDFEKALSLGYSDNNFFALLGFTASRAGKWAKAVMYLTRAITLNPENEMLYAYRGYAYMTVGDDSLSENDYSIYLKHHQDDAISWFGLARAQEDLNENSKAIVSFQKAISLDSTNYEAYFNLGMIYGNMKLYAKAIAEFDTTLHFNPKLPYVYYNRGIAKAKNHLPFCDDFKKCYEMNYTPGVDMYNKFCGGK